MSTVNQDCPGCFQSKGDADVCPHCGYDEREGSRNALPYWTTLQDRYVVGKVLGESHWDILYLCWDQDEKVKTAVRECFPKFIVERRRDGRCVAPEPQDSEEDFRDFLGRFMDATRTLAGFDHPNLVRVKNCFQENGTGYRVMDYYQGMTLAEYIETRPEGRVSEAQARAFMRPIMDALGAMHSVGLLHRGIRPDSIYLENEQHPILLEFGAFGATRRRDNSRTQCFINTPGYTPLELYFCEKEGAWTDIYACAATLYRMVSGQTPVPALERLAEIIVNAIIFCDIGCGWPLRGRGRHMGLPLPAHAEHHPLYR